MENKIPAATLLPYLNPVGAACSLKISLAQANLLGADGTFPFRVISESDPLIRVIEAKMVTDAGSEIKRVFLHVQKDECFFPKDPLWPISNQTIDDSWQKAFSLFAGQKQDPHWLIFSNQISREGKLKPLQSLFFCKITKFYFAPPCPQCGFPLEQCDDDNLLTLFGLQKYSVSLKRYLYCKTCCGEKGSRFYVYELDSSDPPGVGDRWTLIKDFGSLLRRKGNNSLFPCLACSRNEECYGSELQAPARIVPFSFYPFYMFASEALSLNALDFLPLLSGASFEELEAELKAKRDLGRIGCLKALKQDDQRKAPFLFERDERFFLEVLYLKLTFLRELIQGSFSSGDGYRFFDLPVSIDRTWVDIKNHTGLLPFFWNFRVRFMGLGIHSVETRSLPRLPASYGLYSSGLAWFYSLLANRKQEVTDIHAILREAVDRSLSDRDFSFKEFLRLNGLQSPFLPGNIFWNPEGKVVRENWHPLWEKSLLLGWALLRSGFQYDLAWQREEFLQQLEHLREEVKGNLFREELVDGSPVRLSEIRTDDEAIYAILSRFLRRLPQEGTEEKEALTETVLVAPAGRTDLRLAPPQSEDVEIEKAKEILPETVILTPSQAATEKPPSPGEEETKRTPSVQQMEERPFGQDFLTETVILGPAGIASVSMTAGSAGSKEKAPPPIETEKTVVLAKTGKEPAGEDFLAETIVVEPGKGREKKGRGSQ